MFRALLFLFALLSASLALASEEDLHSCARKTQQARNLGAISGLATSVDSTSLYTLAWQGRHLYRFADQSERIGQVSSPLVELTKLSLPTHGWKKNIGLLAVQSRAHSIMRSSATVALADADGTVFVFDTDDMQAAHLPYQSGRFLVGLALAKGESTQLAIFSNHGIEVANVPHQLNHEVRLLPMMAYSAAGMAGGFALQSDDFVAFDNQGQVTRYTKGKATPLAKLPQGIRSLSGYLSGQNVCLWAIDKNGVLWRMKKEGAAFRQWKAQMPAGVTALRISASGETLYPESHNQEEWTEGYYSRTSPVPPHGISVNRVFVVGDDGAAYTPFPATEEQTTLWKVTPGQDLVKTEGMDFPIEIRSVLKGSSASPHEIRLAMKKLSEVTELVAGIESNLADVDQTLLLRTWLNHLRYERYLDTPGSGIEETLNRIGVPRQRAARLIFLDCLSFQEAEAILTQRDLEKDWANYQEINRLLMLGGHDFRRQMARSVESRRLLDYFASVVRVYVEYEKRRLLDQILESPFSDKPLYFAMDAYLAQRSYLWHWNLESEIEDARP